MPSCVAHTHTHTYIYIYIYMCVCVSVSLCIVSAINKYTFEQKDTMILLLLEDICTNKIDIIRYYLLQDGCVIL